VILNQKAAMSRKVCSFIFLLLFSACGWAQSPAPFSLAVNPSALLPTGPQNTDGTDIYSIGFSATLGGKLAVPGMPLFDARGLIDYSYLPIKGIQSQLSMVSFGIGPGLTFTPFARFEVGLSGFGGYSLLVRPSKLGGNPIVGAELSASYALAPGFTLGIGASYRYVVNTFYGFGISLGASFAIGQGPLKSKIQLPTIEFDPIFPVFYKYYDDHPAGRILLKNGEAGTIKKVRVSFLVPQYMAGPKECAVFDELKAGAQKEVPIYALFTDAIIGITEDTKVNARIIVEYSYMDTSLGGETDLSLRVFNRNAMTWDDDRRAAAFVTAKDPALLTFSKGVASQTREQGAAVNAKFRAAMGLFTALDAYGVRYVSDPTSPFTDTTKSRLAIDYLQFPTQTLTYKAGDCDDLSILYCAMNEAVGTETAFITVPGHIFMAFCPDVSAEEARSIFSRPDDVIIQKNMAWIPVEITMIRDGFLFAWRTGLKEWRDAEAVGKAGFFPIRDSWKQYEPAAFIGAESTPERLKIEEMLKAYSAELQRFIDAEIRDRESALKKEIAANANDPKPLNKLGVLYARYGLLEKAGDAFSEAARGEYAPALVNLGNLALLGRDAAKALEYFERAYRNEPKNVSVVVGLAKANFEAGNVDQTQYLYEKLKSLDAKTAQRFSYLVQKSEGTGRAAEAANEDILWSEP
jgi:tetratricopeptide (TPR) repeat protein